MQLDSAVFSCCRYTFIVDHSSSLFFYGYDYHRDLHLLTHSFPTRRSSDLVLASTIANQAMTVKNQYIYPISTQYFRDRTEAEPVNAALLEGRAPDRSFHFQANLVKITPLTVPIDALKNLTYSAQLMPGRALARSEEHPSELQSLMRI